MTDLARALEQARAGGPERHRQKSIEQGKLPVRERVAQLVDEGSFSEDALLANWEQEGFGADGVVTGSATIGGRPACLMANDPTVKAGAGHPMGPLTLADFVGLDTLGSICDVLFDEFRERRFARPPTLRKMLAAGWYGKKSGMGFYDYSGEQPAANAQV